WLALMPIASTRTASTLPWTGTGISAQRPPVRPAGMTMMTTTMMMMATTTMTAAVVAAAGVVEMEVAAMAAVEMRAAATVAVGRVAVAGRTRRRSIRQAFRSIRTI